jgi:hypothetical protein
MIIDIFIYIYIEREINNDRIVKVIIRITRRRIRSKKIKKI